MTFSVITYDEARDKMQPGDVIAFSRNAIVAVIH